MVAYCGSSPEWVEKVADKWREKNEATEMSR